jgi:2,3-bisphosphoglycerate-independent phosphoglycerate mutase
VEIHLGNYYMCELCRTEASWRELVGPADAVECEWLPEPDDLEAEAEEVERKLIQLGEQVTTELRTGAAGAERMLMQISEEVSKVLVDRTNEAAKTAKAVGAFMKQARKVLHDESAANAVMLRGWAGPPSVPSFCESYCLTAAAIAAYPMYRGLGRLVGMHALETGSDLAAELETLKAHWNEHDFFYVHYKDADLAGESGGFNAKKQALEALDERIHLITALKPDVLVITGDHATPSSMEGHSWHPVPLLIWSRWTQGDGIHRFNEREARAGSLGVVEAKHVMMLTLAHAGRLLRFGA